MLNKVILIGRITSDIELRYSNDKMPYTYFSLAVNRDGNSRDKTDFIPCVAFRATAELMEKYLSKGSQIAVEGRLEVYNTSNNGEYSTRISVVVNNINFLDSRGNKTTKNNDEMTFAKDSNNSFESNNINTSSNNNSDEEFDFDNFEIEI